MTDLRKLAALRKEATPGPWTADDWHVFVGAGMSKSDVAQPFLEVDARYIAAAGSLSAEELDALAEVPQLADNLIRSVEGRCSNPRCPSKHVDAAQDCTDWAVATLRAALDRLQETTR